MPYRFEESATALRFSTRFCSQLLEKFFQYPETFCGDSARRFGVQAIDNMPQLEQVLVVGAVGLVGFTLPMFEKARRGFSEDRLSRLLCVAERARNAESSHNIQLVSIKKDLCLQRPGSFAAAETMSSDAVLHGLNPLLRPTFLGQHLPGEIR